MAEVDRGVICSRYELKRHTLVRSVRANPPLRKPETTGSTTNSGRNMAGYMLLVINLSPVPTQEGEIIISTFKQRTTRIVFVGWDDVSTSEWGVFAGKSKLNRMVRSTLHYTVYERLVPLKFVLLEEPLQSAPAARYRSYPNTLRQSDLKRPLARVK